MRGSFDITNDLLSESFQVERPARWLAGSVIAATLIGCQVDASRPESSS